MLTPIVMFTVALLFVVAIGSRIVLNRARPIALSLLLDMSDLLLPKFGGKPEIQTLSSAEELDAFIAKQISEYAIPGAAVAVVANGEVAWSGGYGWANSDPQIPVTTKTAFGLGSISKTVIAVALMQAIEEGHLTLDTAINDILPFKVDNPRAPGAAITMRHLVTHTSGIKDHLWTYNIGAYTQGDPPTPLGQFLQNYLVPGGKHFRKRGNFIAAQPGEEYEYSNIASGLTAYVIEVAVGQPFELYTRQRIFEPLQMKETAWFLRDMPSEVTVATPYNRAKRPYGYLGIASWPDGQLRASASNLGRYLATVMNMGAYGETRILKEESVRQMLAPPLPTLEQDDDEEQFVFWGSEGGMTGHNGGDPGVFTLMYFNEETKIGAIVLTNTLTRKSTQGATVILRQILRGDVSFLAAY